MSDGPLVGVIGGVGPQATAYFLDMVVRLTDAARDQDHLDMVVLNHASIPDRTAFILGESDEDPGAVALMHKLAQKSRDRWPATAVDFPKNPSGGTGA